MANCAHDHRLIGGMMADGLTTPLNMRVRQHMPMFLGGRTMR